MIPFAEFSNVALTESPRSDLHAAPGQFFLAVPPTFDPYLPRVVFPFRLRGDSVESLILPNEVRAWSSGRDLSLRGPYGHGFELPPHARHALVLLQDELAGAQLLALVEALVAREYEVAALSTPNEWMERWLPAEVEYRAVEDLLDAAADLLTWADALFACGSLAFYDQLRAAARHARLRFESGWAQILVRELPMPCGTGVCGVCAFKTTRGVVFNCQRGPVLDLAEWVVEE